MFSSNKNKQLRPKINKQNTTSKWHKHSGATNKHLKSVNQIPTMTTVNRKIQQLQKQELNREQQIRQKNDEKSNQTYKPFRPITVKLNGYRYTLYLPINVTTKPYHYPTLTCSNQTSNNEIIKAINKPNTNTFTRNMFLSPPTNILDIKRPNDKNPKTIGDEKEQLPCNLHSRDNTQLSCI